MPSHIERDLRFLKFYALFSTLAFCMLGVAAFTTRQAPPPVRSTDEKPAVPDQDAPPMEGMMAGVVPGVKSDDPEKMLPVTTFGRYIKILLSSNEFLFVS